MEGLSAHLVVHKLLMQLEFPLVQQKQRKLRTNMANKIKEEIMKKLSADIIRVVEYTTWLANVVPLPKND